MISFSDGFVLNYFSSFWESNLPFSFHRLNFLFKDTFRAGSTEGRMVTTAVDTLYRMRTSCISMVILDPRSHRVGDKLGYFDFQKTYVNFNGCYTPIEIEVDGCSCNFVSIFCDSNILCLTNPLLF